MKKETILHTYDSLEIGDSYDHLRFISEEDVLTFARITGDDNPLHVDSEYAESTRFGHRIVHGVFLLGLISKALGRNFPGPGSVAVSISCRFLRPVKVNSEVRISVKITQKFEKLKYVKAETNIYTLANKMVLAGEATIIPPHDSE
ncbi:MAG: MaoC family dehydratase [Bacteroidetes bacterium]|nr:MaoC family dehydratase [Bacteroidota bacterium]MCY4232841.1 MaoC family dehydratase [Bacteroidota bacterium]